MYEYIVQCPLVTLGFDMLDDNNNVCCEHVHACIVVLVYAIHDNPNLPNCVGVDLLFVFYMYE